MFWKDPPSTLKFLSLHKREYQAKQKAKNMK
jgi:hypothetical protein